MTTIPDDISAMVDELVKMELVRVRPAEPCRQCREGDPCYWHRSLDLRGIRTKIPAKRKARK